jgi:hypothetical protein
MAFWHLSKPGTVFVYACLCAAALCACNNAGERAPQAVRAEGAAKLGGSRAADKSAQVRCEDFITKAEVTAFGLRAEPYNEKSGPDLQAARCSFGNLSAAIWRGDHYAGIVDGITQHGKKAGIAVADGPLVGAETQWTTMPGAPEMDGGKERHTLNFLPPNRKYTASVTGTDRSKIEQVANTLLAKFQKM